MSNNNNQASTRHHYLQKAYLDRFAENARIDVILRQTGELRAGQRTSSIANIRGLYTSTDENGQRDGSMEGTFAREIEGPAIRIINNATSVFPYIPVGSEREVLSLYIALQYLRTPAAKRRFETDAGRLAAMELFNIANNPEKIQAFLQARGEDSSDEAIKSYRRSILKGIKDNELLPNNNLWLQSIADGLGYITPILTQRYNWHIFAYNDSCLITSDQPLVLRKINNNYRGTGFGNADEVLFPLGKKHALILSTDPNLEEGVHFIDDNEHIEMLNDLVLRNSYLEAYCPPSISSTYSGKALGRRPLTQMSGDLPKELKFLERYSGILKRDRPSRN